MQTVVDLAEWLARIWDEEERGVREALKTEEYGVTQFDLARIAADRKILEIHSPDPRDTSVCTTCGEPLEYTWPWPCDTVKALASPYADRPGFREEWR